jgi:hypothetical protein
MVTVPDAADPTTWVAVGIAALYGSMLLSLGWWLARDTGTSRWTALGWVVAVLVTPVGLPYYLYRMFRGDTPGPALDEATRTDRILATWAVATLVAFFFGALVSPPDPFTQIRYWGGALLVTVPGAYVFVYRDGYRRLRGAGGS